MGSPMYPPGTNHFNPYSPLFKKEQRFSIVLSNIGIASMAFILYALGRQFFFWYYLIPYVLVNHWIVMFTFLHHSDPTIPHYRKGEWTFLRGAAGTVDRPLLGWIGRFFFHNISHDHVAHHFFLRAPFYNGPAITKAIKPVLKEHYNYDSTPTFYALYRSFTQCLFIEDEGDIIFYKNKDGIAVRELDKSALMRKLESVSESIEAEAEDAVQMRRPFVPPDFTLKELHDAVPKHLLQKNPAKATYYLLRDVTFALLLYKSAYSITPWAESDFSGYITSPFIKNIVKGFLWASYWWCQGVVGAGFFCLGHDLGHGSLYESKPTNSVLGFLVHSKATGSMERDENYVPYTRSTFSLPDEKKATQMDYAEVLEETPLYTLFRLFIMQALKNNIRGCYVLLSDLGIGLMTSALYFLGKEFFLWYYLIPYIFVNHWIVMLTFLQHSDPTIPHYRKGQWTFLRGAACTVDRPLLGWMGRVFLHNVGHDHVAHHFFLRAPFFNGPEITKVIKTVLKEHYNYDSTPPIYALYRSFTQCVFVEDEGDIVFYKNKDGVAVRQVDESFLREASQTLGNQKAQGVKSACASEQDQVD
ncbi:hypothetical protein NLJ89_g6095 [Agrocybe chaxingu]|uniref:Fatty acid desaturase domain-containing protein n=1 Tax=Agrocybe chaxingu TaxID=84603 RepID=A0A9W8JZT9_9AGAR|nr:hypothetical protein NLJ89_g6095 [Agrocybe chaxingu]